MSIGALIGGRAARMVRLRRRLFAVGIVAWFGLTAVGGTLGAQDLGDLGGSVMSTAGDPVSGVVVDYFKVQADGSRGTWLGDERTNDNGEFNRPVEPGCYVLVAIAPEGATFSQGGRWHEAALCVDAGKSTRLVIQLNTSNPTLGDLGGSVMSTAGDPVSGVVVDYFKVQADGSRGTWLGDERTNDNGEFNRPVEPGCYVLVAIAPEGATFSQGGRWHEAARCVDHGEPVHLVIQLNISNPNPDGCVVGGVPVDTTVTGPECEALIAIFNATGGPQWVDSTGWNTPTDPCGWFGVTCESGQVGTLRLRGNNLVGELPPAIGGLTALRQLFIMENTSGPPGFQGDLRGAIPPELGQLTGLEWLELSNNNFSGTLPAELGQLTELESISVRRNQLTGELPPGLGRLSALENLQLDANRFTGLIPSAIGRLPLNDFSVSSNMLSGDMTEAMTGLRSANPSIRLDIVGGDRTNCLSVIGPDLAAWVKSRDSDWELCPRSVEPCKLPLTAFTNVGLGVPRFDGLVPSLGAVNMAVVFADFADAPATRTPEDVLAILDPTAPDFFADNSYGRMTLALTPHLEWVRLSQPAAFYGASLTDGNAHLAFIQEAVSLADEAFDFSQADVVLVVANPDAAAVPYGPVFNSIQPGRGIQADGVLIPSGITSGFDLNAWGGLWLAHETGHTMSLADLYAYEGTDPHRYVGTFGMMGRIDAQAGGFFAFERWMLGWLDDSQIACHTGGGATFEIAAIENPGGLKAVVVPLNDTSAVVIESRRRIGYDAAMVEEGALVYVVDTSIFSGFGPIRVAPGVDNGPSMERAPIGPGESYEYGGVTISVIEAGPDGDTIQVEVAE